MQVLLYHGADIKVVSNYDGSTPLHQAARVGMGESIKVHRRNLRHLVRNNRLRRSSLIEAQTLRRLTSTERRRSIWQQRTETLKS